MPSSLTRTIRPFHNQSKPQDASILNMKTSIILFSILAAASAIVVTALAAAQPTPPPPPPAIEKIQRPLLDVTVSVPESMPLVISDDLAENFAERVADALGEQGMKEKVHFVVPPDDPAADRPLLAINLFVWDTDSLGNVDCTFSATLTTPQGAKTLGLFSGTSMMMFSEPEWFVRNDQFEEAAREALKDIYQRIVATHLLD